MEIQIIFSNTRKKIILTVSTLWMALLTLPAVAADITTQIPKPDGKSPGIAKPLKVYILAGQSNMKGSAHKSTFAVIGDDPKTAALLGEILDQNCDPVVCDNTWIAYLKEGRDAVRSAREGSMKKGHESWICTDCNTSGSRSQLVRN